MTLNGIGKFIVRHRRAIADFGLIAGIIAVAYFLLFEVRVFEAEGGMGLAQADFALNETLALAGVLCVTLLTFGARRHFAQKRELRRRIAAERYARELAFQDPLTGLPNRRQFDDALREAVGAPPRAGASHAVIMLDLNGFKQVNDVHGHAVGDELLMIVAQRLLVAIREGDLVARLGGDEFAILARHLAGPEAASTIGLRIMEAFGDPIATGHAQHRIGTAIGIALVPQDAGTIEEAMRKADVALYRAKAERRTAMRFFEEGMDRLVNERARTEEALRAAIAAGEVHAAFQPSVDLRTGRVTGFEIVPEWADVPPARFLPIAEDTGLIHALVDSILRAGCAAAVTWPEDVQLSCDIHPGQFKDPDLPRRVADILDETGLPPHRLELEITESAVVHDLEGARAMFSALRGIGVKIVLDNFGTGYSSLYHLRNLKLDKIKIDKSYIDSMATESESEEIVNALIGLGHGLGLAVTAEGGIGVRQGSTPIADGYDPAKGDRPVKAVSARQATHLLAAG